MIKSNVEFIEKVYEAVLPFHISSNVALFIASQFALESNYGRSRLALECNNYTGMRTPLIRLSNALNFGISSPKDEFAKYASFKDCVFDYILWIQFHRPLRVYFENLDSYIAFLKKAKYCPTSDYTLRIMRVCHDYLCSENIKYSKI